MSLAGFAVLTLGLANWALINQPQLFAMFESFGTISDRSVAQSRAAVSVRANESLDSAESVVGVYTIGTGAHRATLALLDSGAFFMWSPKDFGNGARVNGEWHLDDSRLVLRMTDGTRFCWALATYSRGASFDLVPEELLDLYRQNPANVGNHYRYMSREATKLQVSEATPAVSSKGVAVVVNAGRGAVKSDTRLPGEAVPSPALRKESVQARSDLIAATSAPAIQGRDIARPSSTDLPLLRQWTCASSHDRA